VALGASGCSVLDCKFEEISYDVTIGDPYAGPAAPVVDAPSCGSLGDTERGTVYRFDVASVRDTPACFAEGSVSGAPISDVVLSGNPRDPLLNTQDGAPHDYVVTLPSGCRGVWGVDIGIDTDGAAYFAREFDPLSGTCPAIPPRIGRLPRCIDFYTATLTPR
jgi:hypothetical protein